MEGEDPVIDVRGSEVRCSGPAGAAHKDMLLKVPVDDVVICPECKRRYRRAKWWNVISEAVWPH